MAFFKDYHCPYCKGILSESDALIADLMSGIKCPHCYRYIAASDIQYY